MKRAFLPCLLSSMLFLPAVLAGDVEEQTREKLPGTTIDGRVVDGEGRPIADARVLGVSGKARPARKPRRLFGVTESGSKRFPIAETTTDPEGRFEIELEGEAPFLLYAAAEGFAGARVEDVGAQDTPTIRLGTGWAVSGEVLDRATGRPVAGAEVEARPTLADGLADPDDPDRFVKRGETGEKGRFRIEHLEPSYYRFTALAEGYTRASVSEIEVGLGSETVDPVYLYVEPGVDLRGRVVDADGEPIENARIGVRPERLDVGRMRRWTRTGGVEERTDADGKFALRGVPLAPSLRIEARHDDYAPAWLTGIEVRAGRRPVPVEIRLGTGTSLVAKLLADGRPFVGKLSARVTYAEGDGGQLAPRVVRGGDDLELEGGRLNVPRLPPGKASVVLEPQGYAEIQREGVELPEDAPLDLGELLLERGLPIEGKVLGDGGKPLAEAAVVVTAMGPGRFVRRESTSGENGTFAVGGLEDIEYTVTASADGYGRTAAEKVKPGGEPLVLELERAGIIRGRVLAGDPPTPVRGFAVTPQGTAMPGVPFQMRAAMQSVGQIRYRDGGGEFRVEGLAGDTYNLKIEATGFVAARVQDVEVAPGATVDVGDVVLERGATLRGTVVERGSGRGIGGAVVSLQEAGLFDARRFMNLDRGAEITGPDGRFSLEGLAPGRHTVQVDHERFSDAKADIEIAAGVPPADVVIELGSGGAIEGTYRGRDGKPVDGGMVVAMQGFTPSPDTVASTDELGHFRIDHLTPGSYRVMAMGNPMEAQRDPQGVMANMQMQTVEVVDGKTTIVNIPPETGGIVVDGVVRKGGKPLEARSFWVRMAADGSSPEDFAVAASDESGSFQVRLSEPGDYRVNVQPTAEREDWGRSGTTLRVEIPGDVDRFTQDLVIPDIVLSGTVIDVDTGRPLSGVQVLALEHDEDRPRVEAMPVGSAVTDEQGAYRLEGIDTGEYRLSFSKEGYGADSIGPLSVEDGEQEGLNAALAPAPTARVRVVDEAGAPVEGALVFAMSGPLMSVRGGSGESDMNGEVQLTGLPEGVHDLGAVATGLAPAVAYGVPVAPDVDEVAVITLQRGARLRVRVADAQERPVSNAAVRVREVDGVDLTPLLQIRAMFQGRGMLTGPDGTLDLPGLAPGRYDIEVRWQDRVATDTTRVRAAADNEITIDLR